MESSNRPKRQRINDCEIEKELFSDLSGFSELYDSDNDKDFHAPSESTDGSSSGKNIYAQYYVYYMVLTSKIHSTLFFNY